MGEEKEEGKGEGKGKRERERGGSGVRRGGSCTHILRRVLRTCGYKK
jgi:hypothetical protein